MSILNTPEGQSSAANTPDQYAPGDAEREHLEDRRRAGAQWFYWIAAFSLLTSLISLAGGQWGFFLSLGVTRVIDEIAVGLVDEAGINASIKVVAVVFDIMAAGVFALFGYLGARGHVWAFLVGMMLYALDALIFVVAGLTGAPAGIWLSFGFHLFALYYMFNGYRAASRLKAHDARRQVAHAGAR